MLRWIDRVFSLPAASKWKSLCVIGGFGPRLSVVSLPEKVLAVSLTDRPDYPPAEMEFVIKHSAPRIIKPSVLHLKLDHC